MIDIEAIDFAKGGGLVPVVVQDADTLQVLTLAYMDRAALEETVQSGEAAHFVDVFEKADVDGALAASVFHSGSVRIPVLKQQLAATGIEVRRV